jgi:hypothetical protein
VPGPDRSIKDLTVTIASIESTIFCVAVGMGVDVEVGEGVGGTIVLVGGRKVGLGMVGIVVVASRLFVSAQALQRMREMIINIILKYFTENAPS